MMKRLSRTPIRSTTKMSIVFVAFATLFLMTACGYRDSTTLASGPAIPKATPSPSAPTPTDTTSQETPTSVTLRVEITGSAPTTKSEVTVPSGTKVTLTVVPNHSLKSFQILTLGIYATDPYPFSELQYCTYPHTDTCSYTIAYSASEGTDYTKGKHAFRAFLGDIGGRITENSDPITIIWS